MIKLSDILKRKDAPITLSAWDEIDSRAKEVLTSILTTRKILSLNGPKGWDYNAVPEGRLEVYNNDPEKVSVGMFKTKNLIEVRRSFSLNKWELDNITRGAKDIDLSPLEKAVEEIGLFEESTIYNGYKKGGIDGLSQKATHKFSFGKNPDDILSTIGEAKYTLYNSYVQPPFVMVVSPEVYDLFNQLYDGTLLSKVIEKLIGGSIFRSKSVKGAILVPLDNEDLEFTVGQDFSIGYESEDNETVTLFITESFTFRILDEQIICKFEMKK